MSDESGFREKKLFSCTDLAVVEASKVVNKVVNRDRFFFYPSYLKLWGREGVLIQGGCLFNLMAKGVGTSLEKGIYQSMGTYSLRKYVIQWKFSVLHCVCFQSLILIIQSWMRLFMIAFQVNLVFFPLVYDTSSRETFEKLEEWLNEIEMYSTKKDIIKMKKKKNESSPSIWT